MKFKVKSLVTNLLVVVLIISTISFPTISHAEGSSVLIEPNEYDENIIPDIYNTGAHGTLTKIGINDVFGESGKASEVLEKCGLTASSIAKKIFETL